MLDIVREYRRRASLIRGRQGRPRKNVDGPSTGPVAVRTTKILLRVVYCSTEDEESFFYAVLFTYSLWRHQAWVIVFEWEWRHFQGVLDA